MGTQPAQRVRRHIEYQAVYKPQMTQSVLPSAFFLAGHGLDKIDLAE